MCCLLDVKCKKRLYYAFNIQDKGKTLSVIAHFTVGDPDALQLLLWFWLWGQYIFPAHRLP